MMRAFGLVAIALFFATFFASAGAAQLLSERADGLSRLCTYSGTANVVSSNQTRTLRVGIGENCPFSYPAELRAPLPAPPTAQLQTETVSENGRACVYEQAGSTWTLWLEATRSCPLFAGMADQGPARESAE